MADAPKPITGRCLCGSVTYSADAEPVVQAVCHCADCQRQTGNPFSVIVAVPRDALQVEGEHDRLVRDDRRGPWRGDRAELLLELRLAGLQRAAAMPEMTFIKAGSLDDASWLQPTMEAWTSSAHQWSPHFEGAAQFERGPG